jgi:succinate dehydrogenase / fumarate reductase cytochrome b subunit
MKPTPNARPIHRPLSPFWIYRINWTMGLSGTHRITGLLLSIGSPLFVLWLFAIAAGPHAFGDFRDAMLSPFGLVVFAGFVFCIVYHLCNGLRHLGWDMGAGLDVPTAKLTGGLVVLAALALTGTVLYLALWRLVA